MILNWLGVIFGLGAVVGGAILEGLHVSALSQPTAAIIVFGGTLGATMLASTVSEFSGAIRSLPKVFLKGSGDPNIIVTEIVELANLARKEGILALEKSVSSVKNPFLSQNLRHIVDGYDPNVLRDMMEEL